MKRTIIHTMLLSLMIIMVAACKEDIKGPLEGNTTPPGQVRNVMVENQPGRVKLTFELPKDQDLLYIKATYEIRPGVTREVKSSYYSNNLELDGFNDTQDHEVKIFSVNRSEVPSEPIIIKVQPLENPIWQVYRSLKILSDFAGVRITADNPSTSNVILEIVHKDSTGKWQPFLPYIYTSQAKISQTTRGLDTVGQEFGVTVRDRFLNYTDTLYNEIFPLYEEAIPKTLFKAMTLPGDAKIQPVTSGIPLMWDGNTNWNTSSRMLTDVADPEPQYISIDMGVTAKLSRIKIWNYAEFMSTGPSQFYYRGQMRHFEIWGSNNPNPDGTWESWTKLGTFENIKPSGLPYGQNSTEDWSTAESGFDYVLDPDAPKMRYLRFKCIENWLGTTWFEILEVSLYGDAR